MIEMDISKWVSAQYQKDPDGIVCGIMAKSVYGENTFIPMDIHNTDYAEIKSRHDDSEDSFTIKDAD